MPRPDGADLCQQDLSRPELRRVIALYPLRVHP